MERLHAGDSFKLYSVPYSWFADRDKRVDTSNALFMDASQMSLSELAEVAGVGELRSVYASAKGNRPALWTVSGAERTAYLVPTVSYDAESEELVKTGYGVYYDRESAEAAYADLLAAPWIKAAGEMTLTAAGFGTLAWGGTRACNGPHQLDGYVT